MTITEAQYYGGSAEEADWNGTEEIVSASTINQKTGKRRLFWRNEKLLKDRICPECDIPCLECKHYQLDDSYK